MASKITYSIEKKFSFLFVLYLYLKKDLLHRMTNTNDFDLCRQYLLNYVETIKKQLNTYQIELNKQKQTCPIKDLTIDQIDHGLKTFIHSQRKYLSIRNNKEIIQFKENISMEDFSKTLSTGQPTTNQVCS